MTTNSQLLESGRFDNQIIESYLCMAVDLSQDDYSRSKIAQITREINKVFTMPVLLRYGS
jgi:hypothetical protein